MATVPCPAMMSSCSAEEMNAAWGPKDDRSCWVVSFRAWCKEGDHLIQNTYHREANVTY